MDPFFIALTAVSVVQGQRAATAQNRLTQQQLKAEGQVAKLRGQEQHNSRVRNLTTSISANNAFAAFTGRQDRSLKAINDRLVKDTGIELGRIAGGVQDELGQLNLASQASTLRMQNRKQALLLDAFSSGYSNHLRAQSIAAANDTLESAYKHALQTRTSAYEYNSNNLFSTVRPK